MFLQRFTDIQPRGGRSGWDFLEMGLLAVMGQIAVALPPAPGWPNQQAFATVFGLVPRFAIASLVAYWAGEFANQLRDWPG